MSIPAPNRGFGPAMQYGRAKLEGQLHAPRVCYAYIKSILRTRKCEDSTLCYKRRIGTIQSSLPGYGVSRKYHQARLAVKLARAAGLEPTTCGFGDRRSTN